MSAVRVSIIVPVHNSGCYLAECLDSILNQTEQSLEVICVDDGSTDDSPAILATYAQKDPRLTVITQEAHGAGHARNVGLDRACGTYLAFLDSDDFFEKDMCEVAANRLDATGADVAVFGSYVYDVARGQKRFASWHYRRENLPKKNPFTWEDMAEHIFVSFGNFAWNKLYRREMVARHNLRFQEISRANDQFFSCAALILANKIVAIDRDFVFYRIATGTSLQSTTDRDPIACMLPIEPLFSLLEDTGALHKTYHSFIEWILDGVAYNTDNLHTVEGLRALCGYIKAEIEPQYKILSIDPETVDNTRALAQYKDFLTLDVETYLMRRLDALRQDRENLYWINDWRAWRMEQLESSLVTVQNEQMTTKAELERLRSTKALHLGTALLTPCYKLRAFVAGIRKKITPQ